MGIEKELPPDFLQTVIDALPYPFYVINASDYTITMANAAANLGVLTSHSTCHALTHGSTHPCEGEHPCPLRIIRDTRKPVVVEHVHKDARGDKRVVEVHAFPIFDKEGRVVQAVECGMDITDRRKWEEERSDLIRKLQKALDEVKLLSGLLPICASCKKIRDVEGRWNQLESYISGHSQADFSHTLCPECADRLYPNRGKKP